MISARRPFNSSILCHPPAQMQDGPGQSPPPPCPPHAATCAVPHASCVCLQAAPLVQEILKGQAALESLYKIINRQPNIDVSAGGEAPPSVEGRLEFKAVSFAYPSTPDRLILKQFSISVSAGTWCWVHVVLGALSGQGAVPQVSSCWIHHCAVLAG